MTTKPQPPTTRETTKPPTTQPPTTRATAKLPTTQPPTTRAMTKPPTTQPPTTRATINPFPVFPKCSFVPRDGTENETQRIVRSNYQTLGCTTTPSKRQIQHCPADVHKICGSDNSMCLNLKLFQLQVVS